MNKYAIVGLVLVAIIAAGVLWKQFGAKDTGYKETGNTKNYTVIAKKLQWIFEPETITAEQGDRVKINVINEDDFDHGFAIDAFGISQRLPANGSINVDFVASKSGEFSFYCSVSCSSSDNPSFGLKDGKVQSGKYAGIVRGHFDQLGKVLVSAAKSILP